MKRKDRNDRSAPRGPRTPRPYPFTAIVGQEEMKLSLLLNAVSPTVGGVLVMGRRGTAKSTAVRALADLLPPLKVVRGCPYNCDPSGAEPLCGDCSARLAAGERLKGETRAVPVVELPLGATEDRVSGTVDIERALKQGVKAFEPGLLARANRGFLYIDEVNLLEDHLVDLLLDVAATGRNYVEREGVSAEHPARFVLVGSGNPEEGELRPQLLDRFGLSVEVGTVQDLDGRVLIVERRERFERDPEEFLASHEEARNALARRIVRARRLFPSVEVPSGLLRRVVELCARLDLDGHRGELTVSRAARALAALEARKRATDEDVGRVAQLCLRHRLRRDPLERHEGGSRIDEAVEEVFGAGEKRDLDGALARGPGGDSARPANGEGGTGGDKKSRAKEKREAGAGAPENKAGRGGEVSSSEELIVRAEDATLPEGFGRRVERGRMKLKPGAATSRGAGALRTVEAERGRHSGTSPSARGNKRVSVFATLRAMAHRQDFRLPGRCAGVHLRPSDLRYKKFRRRRGTLYVLAVDASGSMALNRIAQAKGALSHVLRHAYVRRDRVAIVSFRQASAEILLPPCSAPERAASILEELPVGGATPLAAGIARALEIAVREKSSGGKGVELVIFTDGRANVPLSVAAPASGDLKKEHIREELTALGAALRREGVASVVVDTQRPFTSDGGAEALASLLGGRRLQLPAKPSAAAFADLFASD